MPFAVFGEVFPHKLDEQFTNVFFIFWLYDGLNHIRRLYFGFYFLERFEYCYYKTLMKNVHYPLVLIRRKIWLCRTLPYYKINLKFSCWSFYRQPLDHCRWVVRKGVDVEWCIVSLSKRKVFLCAKIECNI